METPENSSEYSDNIVTGRPSEVTPEKVVEPLENMEIESETILDAHNESEEMNKSDDESFQAMKIRTKRQTITDSDSEDFDDSPHIMNNDEFTEEGKQHNKQALLKINSPVTKMTSRTQKKSNRIRILDSDSDVEDEKSTHEVPYIPNSGMHTSHHEGNNVPEYTVPKISSWTALCDSDSSDEGNHATEIIHDDNEHLPEEEIVQPTPYRKKIKRKTKEQSTKNKKMTGREAAQQRQEIQSESQRMLREMNVSLPYHRPKAFTLKEFLSRKTKFSSAVPVSPGTPPSVAIKMSTNQLEIISKKLKQHEKEVKEFYKSGSESEGDEDINDEDYVPPVEDIDNQQIEHSENKSTDETSNTENILDEMAQDSGIDTQEIVEDSVMEVSEQLVEEKADISSETNETAKLCNNSEELSTVESRKDTVENNEEIEKIVPTTTAQDRVVNQLSEKLYASEDICTGESTILNLDEEEPTVTGSDISCEKSIESQGIQQDSMEYAFNLDNIEENSEKCLPVETNEQIENEESHSNINSLNDDPDSSGKIPGTNINSNEHANISEPATSVTDKEKLDDIQTSQDLFEDHSIHQSKRFEYTDLDREIENFGNTEKPVEIEKPKLSKMDLIKEKLVNIQPRLSGGQNEIIDLNTEIIRPNEVTKLMQRFVQHTTKIQSHKSKVKLNIVTVESGEIYKETVDMNVDDDEPDDIEEKPGAKLQKLRGELQNRMSLQRLKIWQKKVNPEPAAEDKDTFEGEKSDCGAEDALLDDDEEEEMSESSEEENEVDQEEELEEEEQDEYRIKSTFLDDEADESDRENEEEEAADGDDEDEIDEGVKTNSNGNGVELSKPCDENAFKKPLKRILKGFTEDSDEEDHFDLTSQTIVTEAIDKLDKNMVEVSTQDEDYLPPHQPQNIKTPVRQTTVRSKSEFEFLTPVSYITGLNNLNSASKSKSPAIVSPFQMPNLPSPLKEVNWHANLQKKLFTDSEITSSQAEAIAELCSENTPFTQEIGSGNELKSNSIVGSEIPCTVPVNTQDLLDVCSGEFVDSSLGISSSATPTSQDLLNICSGEFTGVSRVISTEVPQSTLETHTFNSTKEMKSLGAEEDLIISQLLDEEEMEKFKKKFDSPLMTNTQRRIMDEFEEVAASGGVIDSDDDDDEALEVKKRVLQKKLTFSDESSDEEQEEEIIDLHDEIDEDDELEEQNEVDEGEEGIPPDNVGYDSEENEVEYINDKGRTVDFFDKEAELSESEWGSADEDEKDLDTMEFEQGDNEKFDEKKIRSDLEKIHMRRMLDDDTREVKLLQELLLEDGELHGTGRERQFRWKNIDSVDDTDAVNKDDTDVGYLDEEDSEEQWRKKRHEIQMFLKEKQLKSSNTDDYDLLSDSQSQLLKIGQKVIQNSSQESSAADNNKAKPISPDIKSTFSFMNKRGSFLSRSDQVLQRLADYNKQTTAAANSAKNSRNFLFQTVPVGDTVITGVEKKRKAIGGTPKVIKKLRLSDNMSPAVSRKKKIDPPSAKAKLFGQ